MSIKQLWCEKYRPSKIEDYVFHNDSHKKQIMQMIKDKEIPSLLLSGVQGSGKTTLAKILINELKIDKDMDLLYINGSDENSVDTIRDKVKNFSYGYSMGKFKIVFIDEFDYFTPNAQAALRNLIEDVSDTCRFITTCNYKNKVIPAIQSRFQSFDFKAPDKAEVVQYTAKILLDEGVEFDIDLLIKYVDSAYPDIRKIVNLLQQFSIDGKLTEPENSEVSGDYKFKLLDLLQKNDFKGLRKLVCENVQKEEFEEVYRFLYENIEKCPKFSDPAKYEKSIVLIANYLYKNALIADAEINFAACAIELGSL